MTQIEKNALLNYLDFQLLTYVEKFERHVDSDVLHQMYDDAYALLTDLDITIDTNNRLLQANRTGAK
jgi:hypothetical protein